MCSTSSKQLETFMHRHFLITGTGRCGTMYATQYLQAKGLDIPHENMGADGTADWRWTCAWSNQSSPPPTFDRILHLHREPLAAISSLAFYPDIWTHIIANSPVQESDPLLLRCMKHWYYWNLMAEAKAYLSIGIEDWSMKTVGHFFGISGEEPNVRKDVHTKKGFYVDRTWDDLFKQSPELTCMIVTLARHLGYSCFAGAWVFQAMQLEPQNT